MQVIIYKINGYIVNICDLLDQNFKDTSGELNCKGISAIPISKLTDFLGFSLINCEELDTFILKRNTKIAKFKVVYQVVMEDGFSHISENCENLFDGKEYDWIQTIIDTEGSYEIPLNILKGVFGIEVEYSEPQHMVAITDSYTLQAYCKLEEMYPEHRIYKTYIFDIEGYGKYQIAFAHIDVNDALYFSIMDQSGNLLFELCSEGEILNDMGLISLQKRYVLCIICVKQGENYSPRSGTYILYTIGLNEEKYILLNEYTSQKVITLYDEGMKEFQRLDDIADHILVNYFRWNDIDNEYYETDSRVEYFYSQNKVNRNDAQEVITGFYTSIALGLEEEALSYCCQESVGIEVVRELIETYSLKNKSLFPREVTAELYWVEGNRDDFFSYRCCRSKVNIPGYIKKPEMVSLCSLVACEDGYRINNYINCGNRFPTYLDWEKGLGVVKIDGSTCISSPEYTLTFNAPTELILKIENGGNYLYSKIICTSVYIAQDLRAINFKFYLSSEGVEEIAQIQTADVDEVYIRKTCDKTCEFNVYINK